MDCPSCGKHMLKEVSRFTGRVWAVCPECDVEIEVERESPPPHYDSEEEYRDENKTRHTSG